MAAKLILSINGVVLQEYALTKERMTIGRKEQNDIVIDNLAVSGEHAAIVTLLNDSCLEDRDSTNGVSVNGAAIKKHFLQNNDLIEIGKYKLKYLNDQPSQTSAADFEKTMVLRGPVKPPASRPAKNGPTEVTGKYKTVAAAQPGPAVKAQPPAKPASSAAAGTQAQLAQHPAKGGAPTQPAAGGGLPETKKGMIQILTGPNAGKELELVKNLTTLGKPGVQVAVLTHRPNGYFITYVEGATYPMVNAKLLDDQPKKLAEHDIIELAGIKMEFYFKS